jgi:hypothetical protein
MDNDKKFNLIVGLSISAFALYLLKKNNIIEMKFIENKKDFSCQCNLTNNKIIDEKNNKEIEIIDEKNNKEIEIIDEKNNKEIEIIDDNNIKEDVDIIEKDEIKKYNKPFCLTNYIYNLYNN